MVMNVTRAFEISRKYWEESVVCVQCVLLFLYYRMKYNRRVCCLIDVKQKRPESLERKAMRG